MLDFDRRSDCRLVECWGHIDRDGSLVIPLQYEHAEPFFEGLAVVKHHGLSGCINRDGSWAIPASFKGIAGFEQGCSSASQSGKWGYIDRTGRFVIEPTFDFAFSFSGEGLAKVEVDGRYGYIDRSGTLVVEPRYEFAENFVDGFALVCNPDDYSEKWFIDRSGKIALGPFRGAESFFEGWAPVWDGTSWRFIDTSGNTVLRLPPRLFADRFRSGLAAAVDEPRAEQRMGFINKAGEWVIPPQFDSAGDFRDGLAIVEVREKKGMIDVTGRYVIPLRYPLLDDLREDRAKFGTPRRFGFLNERGQTVIEPVYASAQWFSEGLAPVCMEKEP